MFCAQCGKEVENGASVCPYCGAAIACEEAEVIAKTEVKEEPLPEKKPSLKISLMMVTSLVVTVMAFLFGFILALSALATKRTMFLSAIFSVGLLGSLPAIVGLIIGLYQIINGGQSAAGKLTSIVVSAVNGFVLVFTFIMYLVGIVS